MKKNQKNRRKDRRKNRGKTEKEIENKPLFAAEILRLCNQSIKQEKILDNIDIEKKIYLL